MGAGAGDDDGGYAAKVIAEQDLLKRVAAGQNVPPTVVPIIANVAPAPVATPVPVVAPGRRRQRVDRPRRRARAGRQPAERERRAEPIAACRD